MADQDRSVVIKIAASNVTGEALRAAGSELSAFGSKVDNISARLAKGVSAAGAAASDSGRQINGMTSSGIAQLQQLDAEAKKPSLSFRDMATAVGVVSGVVAGMAATIGHLGARGADVADVRSHFADLSEQVGSTADVMLGKLRTATLGNVSDFALMQSANTALSAGFKLNADQMGTLGDVAAVLADRTGGDVKTALDSMFKAMETGRTTQLATLGLTVDSADAMARYAESLGKKATELSKDEKQQAITNAVLEQGAKVLEHTGKAQQDFADLTGQSRAKLSNLVDGISEWVATTPSIGTWSSVVTGASSAVTALGLTWGPVSAGVTKLIPLLSGGAGLTAALQGAVAVLTGPVGLVIGAGAAVIAFNEMKESFTNLPPGLQALASATRSYREDINLASEATKGHTAATAAAAGPTQTLGARVAALDAQLKGISATTRRDLVAALKQGVLSTEDMAKSTGLSADVVKLFKQRLDDETAAQKKATDEQRKFRDAVSEATIKFTGGTLALNSYIDAIPGARSGTGQLGDDILLLTSRSIDFNEALNKSPDRMSLAVAGMKSTISEGVDPLADRITGHLTTALQGIPQIFIDAFTGGGGVIGALKGIGVSLVSAITKEILDPIMAQVSSYAVGIARALASAFTGHGFSLPSFGGAGLGGLLGGAGASGGIIADSGSAALTGGAAAGGGSGILGAVAGALPVLGPIAAALPLIIGGFSNQYDINHVMGGNGQSIADNIAAYNQLTPDQQMQQYANNNREMYEAQVAAGEMPPGYAKGGVVTSPQMAWIAEGGKPEIIGNVDFMTDALVAALNRVGAGGSDSAHRQQLEQMNRLLRTLPTILTRAQRDARQQHV